MERSVRYNIIIAIRKITMTWSTMTMTMMRMPNQSTAIIPTAHNQAHLPARLSHLFQIEVKPISNLFDVHTPLTSARRLLNDSALAVLVIAASPARLFLSFLREENICFDWQDPIFHLESKSKSISASSQSCGGLEVSE